MAKGASEVGWGSGGKEGREGFLVEIVDKYLVDSNSRLIWLSMGMKGGLFWQGDGRRQKKDYEEKI